MGHILWLSIFLFTWLGAALSAAQPTREPLKLLRMTPVGEDVPVGQQIVFEFSRPVVPVGRMERRAEEIPITITPALACGWRWLNTTALACQLREQDAMAPATRYTVTVRPGITTQDGATLAAEVHHTFITQRPRVVATRFHTWTAPGTPEMVVVFDQPVTGATVAQHLYVQTEHGQRLALSAAQEPQYNGRGWKVRPGVELPLDTQIELQVEPGIVSTRGPEPGAEQRTIVTFATFPPLRFLGVQCMRNTPEERLFTVSPTAPPSQAERCKPLRGVALLFSAPVPKEAVKEVLRLDPALASGDPDHDSWAYVAARAGLSHPHRKGDAYALSLPGVTQAYTIYHLQALPQQITDVFGRVLAEAIDMQFATDHRLPDYAMPHPMAVLEQQVETHVPLEVVNLQAVHLRYETLTSQGRQPAQTHTIPLNLTQDTGYTIPLKMRELLPAASGAIQGYLDTTPAVRLREPPWFFSQVTPFAVHVKIGHYNTLVWVTRFDTGLPVSGVRVQCYVDTFGTFRERPDVLAEAVTDASGLALLPGTTTLDPELTLLNAWQRDASRLFLQLEKDGDMALIPLAHDFAVYGRGVFSNLRRRYGHIHAWGSTPQGVYKVGDTVQFKFYVRDQDNQRFIPPPRTGYTLQIIDPMDKVVHEVRDLQLSDFGAYNGEFAVPQNGAVGWYRFVLSLPMAEEEEQQTYTWEPMRVLISDFTPAPFRVTTDLHGTRFSPGDTVTVTTQATLHAGGPYGTAQTRLTAMVQGQPLVSEDPQATGFYFAVSAAAGTAPRAQTTTPEDESSASEAEATTASDSESFSYVLTETVSETLHQSEDLLNDQGTLEKTFTLAAARVVYGQLRVESAVQDDRGKYVAGYATARYVGRDRYVGVRQPDWLLTAGKPAQLQVLVVNEQGAAVAGTEVRVQVRHLQLRAAQVKGAGNAYLPHYVRTWVDVATCTLVSETAPGICPYTPPEPGVYTLTASIVDTRGRAHRTSRQSFAVGAGWVLWPTTPDHHLQVLPEKQTYKVGDTARYLVQNPYPGAQALITLERFGVQHHWREIFSESTAVIEVPVTPDHLPGFYLSVVVMSPRVDKPLGDNQVDLGKPAFRMGYVQTLVQDPYKELRVEVQPRQAVYKPRDTATVDLRVHTRQGDMPPVELAVAVLDEAVFDLIAAGRNYFDPYKGFYTLDALDLRNYNLLTLLVGRRKFDKKGANPGGDGGLDLDLRSVFKFVSYWNPALVPDAAGKATISFELPDNLTGWRVLAMAVTPEDRMGLGEGHFKANKPTEIRPALPNQVIAGDRFDASFTILNRTAATRTLEVVLSASGPVQASDGVRQRLEAEPYKRYTVRLPVQTTRDGEIRLRVRAGDSQDQDALELTLPVRKRQALEVAATYGTTTADEVKEAIAFPPDMRTDVGHVSVVAAPTVIGGVDGAFTYMRRYPYLCWEQQLTKGVMAAHYRNLRPYLPPSLEWPESEGLPQHTLELAVNYQAPSGGMTYYIPQEQYVSPDLSAYTALAFNWLRASGYTIPAPVEARLHDYLLTFLRRNAVPDFYTRGMSATVRALALAALAPHGKLSRADVQRYHAHVQDMSLFGKAHYLLALTRIPDTADLQAEVATLIRAHANETGGKFIFSEAIDVAYQRILESPLRSNCAILSAFLAYENPAQGGAQPSDVPYKLTRTITQARQNRNRWENTQENMFCMNALIDFSRVYERDTPDLTLRADLDGRQMGEAQFRDVRAAAVDFQYPVQAGDAGREATVTITRQGQGRIYYSTRLFYTPAGLKTEPINAGIEVHREYSVQRGRGWLLLASPMDIRAGELVKVDLYLSLPAARNFVVVDDPVPGGLEPVNRDLATASQADAEKAAIPFAGGAFWFRYNDWWEYGQARWSFYHRELRHHAVRFYSEYLPAGRYHLAYVAQAIAAGEFAVPPVHAEEMYNPDTFGQGVPAVLRIVREERQEAQR
jgi:hypothetical protein